MKTKIYSVRMVTTLPLGTFQSMPAEIGSANPSYPVKQPRPLEHPTQMSNAAEFRVLPLVPENGSTLALPHPQKPPADSAEPRG